MSKVKADKPVEGEGAVEEARRGRGRPQQRSDEETRVVILEAARYEFSHTGYAATGMESVARRAGVSDWVIKRTTRHKSSAMLDRYTHARDLWDENASGDLGL